MANDNLTSQAPQGPGTASSAQFMKRPAEPTDKKLGRLEPDPAIEAYKAGIDRTLLRQNLKRSPAERLANLVALQRFAEEVRRAGRTARDTR